MEDIKEFIDMRMIKFRGKTTNGKWIYGDLVRQQDLIVDSISYCIFPLMAYDSYDNYVVYSKTIGQFTGLYDKDGKEIYEGDILGRKDGGALLKVEFRHGAFGYEYCGEFHSLAGNHNFTFNPFDTDVDFAIIDNIHDNPELLNSL